MLQLTDSLSLFSPKHEWEVEECINNIFSKKLSNLTITLTEFDTFEESQHTLLNCMGEPVKLDNRPVLQDAARWALGKLSEGFYKHKLGHCESDCMCKHPEVGKWPHLGYWMQFDIINIEGYRELGLAVKQLYLDNHRNSTLEVKAEVTVLKYLEDQLIVDCAYDMNNGYNKPGKFLFRKGWFDTLSTIAKYRYEQGQPTSDKLKAFLVYNIGEKNQTPGTPKPAISNRIDYRIMYMLESLDAEAVYNEINSWGYFKTVNRTASGGGVDSSISAVVRRYLKKHPV